MIIDRAAWADWLDPDNSDVAAVRRLLAPATSGGLTSHPVSPAVNSVRNNGPELTAVMPDAVAAPGAGPPGQVPADPGGTLF
jgi:putative SOS response-associated peptidase YedK